MHIHLFLVKLLCLDGSAYSVAEEESLKKSAQENISALSYSVANAHNEISHFVREKRLNEN